MIIIEGVAAVHVEVSRLQLHPGLREKAEFEVAFVDSTDLGGPPGASRDERPPLVRNPREREVMSVL